MSESRSTMDELLARQLVRPVLQWCPQPAPFDEPRRTDAPKGFRPGLRVVAVEEQRGDHEVDRWQDHPAGVIIDIDA